MAVGLYAISFCSKSASHKRAIDLYSASLGVSASTTIAHVELLIRSTTTINLSISLPPLYVLLLPFH